MGKNFVFGIVIICVLVVAVTGAVIFAQQEEKPQQTQAVEPVPAPPLVEVPASPPAQAAQAAEPVQVAQAPAQGAQTGTADVLGPAKTDQEKPVEEKAANVPAITSPEPTYDFGKYDNTEDVEHDFIVKNTGTATLKIKEVKTSCGCTAAKPEKDSLEPGEEAKIHTKLSLKNRQGKQAKSIMVHSNDPKTPVFRLQLTGEAIAAVMIDPRVINYGKVMSEELKPETVRLYTPKEDFTFHVESVDTEMLTHFKVDMKTVTEGKEYEFTITNTEPLSAGRYTGALRIHLDSEEHKMQTVNVFAQVVGDLDIAPDTINLRASDDPDKTSEQYLRIGPGRVKEFTVQEVIVPVEGMTADIMPRGENIFLIKLSNMPLTDALEGKELIVKTSVPTLPEIKIPFKIIKTRRPSRYTPTRPLTIKKKPDTPKQLPEKAEEKPAAAEKVEQ